MKVTIISEVEKELVADKDKALTNGDTVVEHPLILRTNINDESWTEVDFTKTEAPTI